MKHAVHPVGFCFVAACDANR